MGPIIVPVKERVVRILLVIIRDGKRNGLVDDIRRSAFTLHVGVTLHRGHRGLGTETTSRILAEGAEVFSPNLNGSASILRSVSRVDSSDPRVGVVGEGHGVLSISPVASDSDCNHLDLFNQDSRVILALKAVKHLVTLSFFAQLIYLSRSQVFQILRSSSAFFLIEEEGFSWALDVGREDFIVTETTPWTRILVNPLQEWTNSNRNTGLAGKWSLMGIQALDAQIGSISLVKLFVEVLRETLDSGDTTVRRI
jgi:hypothetical protein